MLIRVKVFPGSKTEEVVKVSENSFEVKTKEPPLQGRANKRVAEMLALYFNVSQANIRLLRGFKERNKIFEICLTN